MIDEWMIYVFGFATGFGTALFVVLFAIMYWKRNKKPYTCR